MFAISEELQATLVAMRAFVEDNLHALEPDFVASRVEVVEPRVAALRAEVKRRGWWAPQVPREYGGMGLSLLEHARVSEVLGRSPLGHYTFGAQAPDAGNLEILLEHGSPAQKERWAKPLAAGQIRSCFAMTEPEHAGSEPTVMGTRAVLEGDEWVIDGHKWFTSSADGAAFTICMAVTDPEQDSKYGRASMILVPTDNPGFQLVRNISVMGEAGHGYSSHAEVRFEGCRVPRENLLGPRGGGFALAQDRLGPGRIHHCMRWIGIAERAFEMMCQRAATRLVHGGRPLGTKQSVQNWIAESRVELDAARLLVLHAASRVDAVGSFGARAEISGIKFYCARVLNEVLDRALQVHGALGMTDDTILAWYWRHERAARIYDGPDEVHKVVVARQVLKKYGL